MPAWYIHSFALIIFITQLALSSVKLCTHWDGTNVCPINGTPLFSWRYHISTYPCAASALLPKSHQGLHINYGSTLLKQQDKPRGKYTKMEITKSKSWKGPKHWMSTRVFSLMTIMASLFYLWSGWIMARTALSLIKKLWISKIKAEGNKLGMVNWWQMSKKAVKGVER